MNDVFNNSDIIINNASQTPKGLSPDSDIGEVIIKPKEDIWLLANTLQSDNIYHSPDSMFQVSTYDNYPLEIGIGYYTNNELQEVVSIVRDTTNVLYLLINYNGDKERICLRNSEKAINTLNTVAIEYIKGLYKTRFNKHKGPGSANIVLFNDVPVFYVRFDTILKAAVIGPLDKFNADITNNITEKPNYFIKDTNE